MLCSFQFSWFSQWPFLHYDEVKDVVFGHTCSMSFKLKRMKANSTANPAFVSIKPLYLNYRLIYLDIIMTEGMQLTLSCLAYE